MPSLKPSVHARFLVCRRRNPTPACHRVSECQRVTGRAGNGPPGENRVGKGMESG